MPTIDIKFNPGLTKEDVLEVFKKYLSKKYGLVESDIVGCDFFVKKSGWCGVGVMLKHKRDRTSIHFDGDVPGKGPRALGALGRFFVPEPSSPIMNDVKQVIETAPEFKVAPVGQPHA
jgi:hypothetical protein